MRCKLISLRMMLLGTSLFGLALAFAWSQQSASPRTPVDHVVVIFQENQSFDHYFATYPNAANLAGEPLFHAAPGTPTVNGLSETLRTRNPNSEQPWRISRSQAVSVIFLTWDDSDGWYDHVMPPVLNHSQAAKLDTLMGPKELCGSGVPIGGYQGRCAYGPRIPLLIISPFSRVNFVDHSLTDQTSLIKFIEDNWDLGRIGGGSFDALAGSALPSFDFEHPHPAPLELDPETGKLSSQP